jgi:hypothetical protein
MNLQFAVSNLLRQLGALLGLVSIVSVSFQPLEARIDGDSLEVTARLDGAVTEEIEALIDASARVVIAYEVVELFADDTQRRVTVRKVLRYDALQETYRIRRVRNGAAGAGEGEAGVGAADDAKNQGAAGEGAAAGHDTVETAEESRAHALLSRLVYETPRRAREGTALTAVIVKAGLEVPGVDDPALVRGLWAGKTPTAVYRVEEAVP